jgi:hypothetical protein
MAGLSSYQAGSANDVGDAAISDLLNNANTDTTIAPATNTIFGRPNGALSQVTNNGYQTTNNGMYVPSLTLGLNRKVV